MSVSQWEALPAGQKPTMFRDPDPRLGYPYNVHETDGLSRNPNDCTRWGCIDVNAEVRVLRGRQSARRDAALGR